MIRNLFLLILAGVVVCAGCRTPAGPDPEIALERFEFRHPAMGTLFHITLYAADREQASEAATAAFARIDQLEEILSDYQADSELSLLRGHPPGTPVPVSPDLFEVLVRARKIYKRTDGAFDITAGSFSRLWRFSRKRHKLPTPEEVAEARVAVGMRNLKLDRARRTVTMTVPGMRLDVGGIAKGFSADEALKCLRDRGTPRALIAASGDIVAGEPPPGKAGWTVAVAGVAPTETGPPTLLLRNRAVSTSGDTEQFLVIDGVRYSHILDPGTGLGLTNRIQATVVAPNATLSDALATSVCIMGSTRGLRLINSIKGTAAMVVEESADGWSVIRSRRFESAR